MKKIKKILACVDFSEYSLITLEYAVALAEENNTEIIVYNVVNQRNISGIGTASLYFPYDFNIEEYTEEQLEESYREIEKMIDSNFPDQKSIMFIKVDKGIPFECILDTINTEEIDLVVMANKGRSNLSKVLFGSSAEKVFRHSPVPVVSVRDKTKFRGR